MKILIVSQYFWPESFLINDFSRKLAERGHDVVIATGKPNYPDGDIYSGYKSEGVQREFYAGNVEVIRVPIRPRGKGGAFNLAVNYLSFVFSGLVNFPKILRGREFDFILVFAVSPITQVIPAIFLKWLKSAHLAVWVQDLWPESLSATGFVKRNLPLRLVGGMVRVIYSCCNTILVQSQAFFDSVRLYADSSKIVYFPNSIDPDSLLVERASIPAELAEEIEDCFSVVFAGNIGSAQSIDTIVNAAFLLQDCQDLKIFVVGSGSRSGWVRAQKEALGLKNLVIPGRFSMESMPHLFRISSALLVSLKRDRTFSLTIPSKVQAYLAAGRPIVASLDGEGARVVSESGAGVVSFAEDAVALAANIRHLYEMTPEEREHMGRLGRAYFAQNFDMNAQSDRLIDILVERSGSRVS
ncbi:glycosyltransferase family 4 protein [Metapseudomonas lalkuanensis]|uniref:glycosyltransferase family 4 protein n=1 Tax=Metapseudomonas lalkuanensis TaxID=2604832 RepID=UPI001CF33F0C|nr:glycosyltransferase family 4 protein [Pseudomonas lalkuanensis]UCP00014.1 glycosyltransferase family 4 protein [Pseudomonas lalkuanensis]